MKITVITNNQRVSGDFEILWVDGSFRDVLIKARDMVYSGHNLLASPLPASIRGMYSPVRSIIVGSEAGSPATMEMEMIGDSIEKYDLILGERNVDYSNQEGYEIIDAELLKSALEELKREEFYKG